MPYTDPKFQKIVDLVCEISGREENDILDIYITPYNLAVRSYVYEWPEQDVKGEILVHNGDICTVDSNFRQDWAK